MNDDFMVLNEFVGYGNPKGRFWFIGLEEAGDWKAPPSEVQMNGYRKRFLPRKAGDIKNQADQQKEKYTKIHDVMSKLVLAVTRQVDPESGDWRKYRNEQLLVEGGDTFQANLYPLARRSSSSKKLPEKYQELFDVGEWYQDEVLKKRFDMLYREWKEYHPRFTICFGKGEWRSFEKLLRLKIEPPYEEVDKCRIYRSGVVLCPFFKPTDMSNDRIRALAQRLREFEQAA